MTVPKGWELCEWQPIAQQNKAAYKQDCPLKQIIFTASGAAF
jgi:hypothetical protein